MLVMVISENRIVSERISWEVEMPVIMSDLHRWAIVKNCALNADVISYYEVSEYI